MKLLAKIGMCGLIAGGTASALYADPAGGWLSPNGTGAGAASTTTVTTDPSLVRPVPSMSLAEMQPRVRTMREQTRTDAQHIAHLQVIARREKDVIKLNCVNDKLVQVKPQMNVVDNQEAQLAGATDANRMQVFESISQAAEGVRRLREEADQCIGEPMQTGGESSNSFTAPTAPDDPTKPYGGGGGGTTLEPPAYASPYL
jgi:hypothetical protein